MSHRIIQGKMDEDRSVTLLRRVIDRLIAHLKGRAHMIGVIPRTQAIHRKRDFTTDGPMTAINKTKSYPYPQMAPLRNKSSYLNWITMHYLQCIRGSHSHSQQMLVFASSHCRYIAAGKTCRRYYLPLVLANSCPSL